KTVPYLEKQSYADATVFVGDTIAQLAHAAGIDAEKLQKTVEDYNRGCPNGATIDPMTLDGNATRDVVPPKTNWAGRVDTPPFEAYPVTTGMTFAYGGVAIDTFGRVLNMGDRAVDGLFAAGEMAGGFFYFNYPAGAGLMRGAVTGRIAGTNAARFARGNELWN